MDQITESASSASLLSTLEHAQSPSILVSPTAAPPSPFALTTSPPRLSTHSTAVSRSPSTKRSPASPSRARSHSPGGMPLAPGAAFASRPSPVVPSPGSGVSGASVGGAGLSPSRPVSPGPRSGLMRSPERSERRLSGSAMLEPYDHGHTPAQPEGGLDLNHIFERDVEFTAAHSISPQEAIDVAVPPVLDEAALALTSSTSSASLALDQLVTSALSPSEGPSPIDQPSSGWSSPISVPTSSALSDAGAARSPTRGARSFSPDSATSGRATSPESFSVGTPPDGSVGGGAGLSQGLSSALEGEARKARAGSAGGGGVPFKLGAVVKPATSASPPRSPTNLFAPVPFPSSMSISTLSLPTESPGPGSVSGAGSPHPTPGASLAPAGGFDSPGQEGKARRLSFISYSDILNEERLSEITGSPLGGELGGPGTRTPSRAPSGSSGGQVKAHDLAGALNQLDLQRDV